MNPPSDRIHAEWSGSETGQTVVLIHGSLDRSAGMARLARLLNPQCRVLRYDRRGYARSWPHLGPFGVDAQVEDLRSLVGDRPVVLIGHSYGGNVALAASVAMGAQVTGVSVFETPFSWMEWWPSTTAGAATVAVSPEDAAEAFMKRLVGESVWQSLPQRTKDARRREGTALQSELGWLRQHEPWRAEDITVPLVCGRGTRGSAHHERAMRWLAEQTGGTFVEIEGAGHGAPNSHPAEFVELLVRPHIIS